MIKSNFKKEFILAFELGPRKAGRAAGAVGKAAACRAGRRVQKEHSEDVQSRSKQALYAVGWYAHKIQTWEGKLCC